MIILLEGPDKAGKTTLAQSLFTTASASNTWSTVHLLRRGPIRHDVFTEYLRPLDKIVADTGNGLHILDRWHVGELIYGPVLRGESKLTERQAAYMEMVLQSLGCRFVHITATPDVLERRWDEQPDSLVKREWLAPIRTSYYRYVDGKNHWMTFANGGFEIPVAFERSPMPGRYIGPRRPAVLLLGDERNKDTYTWPFVPERATSGHWLMGALAAAEVDHMRVGIVNACELAPEDLNFLWYDLGKPPVVAMGKNATRSWDDVGGRTRPSAYVHHPQYSRRFHYMKFKEYGLVIKEAMNE